METSFPNRS